MTARHPHRHPDESLSRIPDSIWSPSSGGMGGVTDSGTPDRADKTADQLRMPKMLPAIGAMIAVAVVLVSGFVLLGLWLVDFPGSPRVST